MDTKPKVVIVKARSALHAYGVRCESCEWSDFVQGHKARESARESARRHRDECKG
jgi:hypothetical protein